MQLATALAQVLSILAFGWYGALTLLSEKMVAEFERYRLGRLRVFTATLQIVGAWTARRLLRSFIACAVRRGIHGDDVARDTCTREDSRSAGRHDSRVRTHVPQHLSCRSRRHLTRR